jgi:hypothetical protein
MASFLQLMRAELRRAVGRRAIRGFLVLALAIQIVLFWGNFYEVTNLRNQLSMERSIQQSLRQNNDSDPESLRTLQNLQRQNQQDLRNLRTYLGPRYVHRFVLGFWGTLPGILTSMLLAATLFGAEFRWDYWKMLAIQEPRRVRIVGAKLIVLGLLTITGLLVLLLTSFGLNELFLNLHNFKVERVRPPLLEIAGWLGRAFITTYTYGTIASAISVAFKSALSGFGGAFGVLFLDTFVQRVLSGGASQFTPYTFSPFPAQQVANLFVGDSLGVAIYGRIWFLAPQAAGLAQVRIPEFHLEVIPPPAWQAAIVLAATVMLTGFLTSLIILRKEL